MKKIIMLLGVGLGLALAASPVLAQPFTADPGGCDDGGNFAPCESAQAPEVFEAINYLYDQGHIVNPGLGLNVLDPNYTTNKEANADRYLGADRYWVDLGGGVASNFAAISITADNDNTLGVFKAGDAVPAGVTDVVAPQTGNQFLGDVTIPKPFPGGILPGALLNQNFGFALKSTSDGGATHYVYSDPNLNADSIDHMITYYLPDLAGLVFDIDTNNDGIADNTISLTKDTWLIAFEDLLANDLSYDRDYNDTIFLVTRLAAVPEPMTLLLMGSGLAAMAGARRRKSA